MPVHCFDDAQIVPLLVLFLAKHAQDHYTLQCTSERDAPPKTFTEKWFLFIFPINSHLSVQHFPNHHRSFWEILNHWMNHIILMVCLTKGVILIPDSDE